MISGNAVPKSPFTTVPCKYGIKDIDRLDIQYAMKYDCFQELKERLLHIGMLLCLRVYLTHLPNNLFSFGEDLGIFVCILSLSC